MLTISYLNKLWLRHFGRIHLYVFLFLTIIWVFKCKHQNFPLLGWMQLTFLFGLLIEVLPYSTALCILFYCYELKKRKELDFFYYYHKPFKVSLALLPFLAISFFLYLFYIFHTKPILKRDLFHFSQNIAFQSNQNFYKSEHIIIYYNRKENGNFFELTAFEPNKQQTSIITAKSGLLENGYITFCKGVSTTHHSDHKAQTTFETLSIPLSTSEVFSKSKYKTIHQLFNEPHLSHRLHDLVQNAINVINLWFFSLAFGWILYFYRPSFFTFYLCHLAFLHIPILFFLKKHNNELHVFSIYAYALFFAVMNFFLFLSLQRKFRS